MERRIEHPPRLVAVGLPHVDAGHSDTCFKEALEHPLLFGAWKPRQRGSIEHPRNRFPSRWRSQNKGRVAADGQHLTGQRQHLLGQHRWLRLFGPNGRPHHRQEDPNRKTPSYRCHHCCCSRLSAVPSGATTVDVGDKECDEEAAAKRCLSAALAKGQ